MTLIINTSILTPNHKAASKGDPDHDLTPNPMTTRQGS